MRHVRFLCTEGRRCNPDGWTPQRKRLVSSPPQAAHARLVSIHTVRLHKVTRCREPESIPRRLGVHSAAPSDGVDTDKRFDEHP
eukprot:4285699-Pleurochrysis_carterae.AAC.2